MAITDIKEYAHLSEEDVEAIGREFAAIRADIEASLGEEDAAYIHGKIDLQRRLAVAARATLLISAFPPAWLAGTTLLSLAKILENMELGHNIMHGQWDWMNDPEIHSSTWEWDNVCPGEQWRHSHNWRHHQYTNVIGMDRDIGYGILRMTADQPWKPMNLGQPIYNALLALLFEWGVGAHDLDIDDVTAGRIDPRITKSKAKQFLGKIRRQVVKDYIVWPLLSGPSALPTLVANVNANLVRNLWSYAVIFCGHFPDGTEKFSEEEWDNETPAEWHLRQILAAANFEGPRWLHVLAGSLSYQIEHHAFPDLPSNRFPEIAERIRALCEEYDLPYNTGSFVGQYGTVLRTILRLSLPGGPLPEGPGRGKPVMTEKATAEVASRAPADQARREAA